MARIKYTGTASAILSTQPELREHSATTNEENPTSSVGRRPASRDTSADARPQKRKRETSNDDVLNGGDEHADDRVIKDEIQGDDQSELLKRQRQKRNPRNKPQSGNKHYTDDEREYFSALHDKDIKGEYEWEEFVRKFNAKFEGAELTTKSGKTDKRPARSKQALQCLKTDEKVIIARAEWKVRRIQTQLEKATEERDKLKEGAKKTKGCAGGSDSVKANTSAAMDDE